MKKHFILFLIIFCSFITHAQSQNASIANDGKVWASLYQQRAAEYRALCYQAYNVAKLRLSIAVKQHHKKPYAVIADIDETLLDNSPYDAERAVNNQEFELKSWKQWTAKGICDTVPGGPEFFKYAASKGVEVFYITNRYEDERAGTLKNLQYYHLPNANNAHLILKQKESSKETRRQDILKTHDVILYCGDNLTDFDALYDNQPTEAARKTATNKLKSEFGDRYIVLPNPSYDDWESAIFQYNFKLTNAQKDSIIKAKLKTNR